MSMEVFISLRAEQDMTLQYRWYLKNADLDVAERYLLAVHETIQTVAKLPDLGLRRRFKAPELARIRSIPVKRPFQSPPALLCRGRDPARRARHARRARSATQTVGRPRRRPESVSEWMKLELHMRAAIAADLPGHGLRRVMS